jgi:addiction module HigA family antidote
MARSAIHPGEHLAEELEALGMSAAELARRIQAPTNRVTEILNGQRAITADTALRLGHFFGTSAEMWLNLQKIYELRVAAAKLGDRIAALPVLDRSSWTNADLDAVIEAGG